MSEPKYHTVNGVIAALHILHGETVQVAGVLYVEFEGNSLCHSLKAERSPDYESCLWAEFDHAALGLSLGQLQEYHTRHVVVTGLVDRYHKGHLGLWPGAVLIQAIDKAKAANA